MRIGTWNLAGRWSEAHAALLARAECEVWLLTEVHERTELPGYEVHASAASMTPERRWAAIATTRPLAPEPDPHPASVRTRIGSTTFVSSVLPWRSCGSREPWIGEGHAARTVHTVERLVSGLGDAESLVWGGDWNHALSGEEHAGSRGGRAAVLRALEVLDLHVPTADLPHVVDGLLTIDHVAVPRDVAATASRVVAEHDGRRLSDHDVYVVDAEL